MKEIKLSESRECPNRGKYVALVDDEDYEEINQHRWSALVKGHTVYAFRVFKISGKSVAIMMHRHIMGLPIIMTDGLMVDHIDRNGLNCQKANMRVCDSSTNNLNRVMGPRKVYSGKFLREGIRICKANKKWTLIDGTVMTKSYEYYSVRVRKDGRPVFIGNYHSQEDAIRAQNKALSS